MTDQDPTMTATPASKKPITTPEEVGPHETFRGALLRAAVEFGDEAGLLDWYEVQLAGRGGERSKTWDKPIWRHTSDRPRFVAVDGRAAGERMSVERRRPQVELVVERPIDAYSWELTQDGDLLEEHEEVSRGISEDGLRFDLRPTRRLRRSGRRGRARRKGVFYPPFDSHLPGMPRTAESRIRYTALTHPAHVDEDAYAVDFNWGTYEDDRGHWVRSAAAGRVSKIIEDNGQVQIEHPRFDGKARFETVYAHLQDIRVKEREWVRGQQKLGRIGSTFFGDAPISPHLHHQHRKEGQPIKMRLYINGEVTPLEVSKPDGSRGRKRESKPIPGWIRPRGPAEARVTVRTRDAETGKWSRQSRLSFRIAAAGAGLPAEAPVSDAATVDGNRISIAYDGPALEPGEYSLRYRARSDAGAETPWAYDHSVVIEQALATSRAAHHK